jgi:hypothetical protein
MHQFSLLAVHIPLAIKLSRPNNSASVVLRLLTCCLFDPVVTEPDPRVVVTRGTGVTLEVVVDCECCIYMPLDDVAIVGHKSENVILGSLQEVYYPPQFLPFVLRRMLDYRA